MGILMGAVKGAALGILYALVASPPFGVWYFRESWSSPYGMLPLVALCSVPAGAGVGALVVLTGAYRRGAAWRAQLAMLAIYALTGIVFFHGVGQGLDAAVHLAPVFVPVAILTTWLAVLWIRRGAHHGPKARTPAPG